jgi:hypothetical protein
MLAVTSQNYVYVNDLSSAEHVRSQLAGRFTDYNENTPHKELQMGSLREYLREAKPAA